MGRFSIAVAHRDTEAHAARYDDFCHALGQALRDLGHEVVPAYDQKPGRLIMFNMNNVFDPEHKIPDDAILYNTEQVAAVANPRDAFTAYKEHQDRVIWEYSEANETVLRALGMKRVVRCPVGYHPSMQTVENPFGHPLDVDVLFYGALTPRRQQILTEIVRAGLTVKALYGVFGMQRDAWIARAKVVLNLHYGFELGAVFEIFRVSHLVANKKCVVSERQGNRLDPTLAELAREITISCYAIPEACVQYVEDTDLRGKMEQQGFDLFATTSLVNNVRRALETS